MARPQALFQNVNKILFIQKLKIEYDALQKQKRSYTSILLCLSILYAKKIVHQNIIKKFLAQSRIVVRITRTIYFSSLFSKEYYIVIKTLKWRAAPTNPESRIPNPESRIPNPESQILNLESRISIRAKRTAKLPTHKYIHILVYFTTDQMCCWFVSPESTSIS